MNIKQLCCNTIYGVHPMIITYTLHVDAMCLKLHYLLCKGKEVENGKILFNFKEKNLL